MRNDARDAATLRDAAWVLRTRAPKRTFLLRVLCRVLELHAGRIGGKETLSAGKAFTVAAEDVTGGHIFTFAERVGRET